MRSKRRIIRDPREHIYPPSAYVRDLMTDFYGPFNGEIFYPPTTFEPLSDNVEKEPLRVVYLGRINPEKRIPDICDIVEKARNLSGKDLKLIIAGPYDKKSAAVNDLLSYIRQRPWISLLDGAFGEEKSKLLHSGTYAVHARRNEEFGISITEYLKAGLIPIVPNEGGSREVVDAPDLTYSDNDMAAKILVRLLTDAEFREQQRRHCAERAKVFSRENYFARQTELLDKILAEAE
jgi:glycosyltransferase involved in cell wall biosynthesis